MSIFIQVAAIFALVGIAQAVMSTNERLHVEAAQWSDVISRALCVTALLIAIIVLIAKAV